MLFCCVSQKETVVFCRTEYHHGYLSPVSCHILSIVTGSDASSSMDSDLWHLWICHRTTMLLVVKLHPGCYRSIFGICCRLCLLRGYCLNSAETMFRVVLVSSLYCNFVKRSCLPPKKHASPHECSSRKGIDVANVVYYLRAAAKLLSDVCSTSHRTRLPHSVTVCHSREQ